MAVAGTGIGSALAEDNAATPQAEKIRYESYFNEPSEHGGRDQNMRDQLVAFIDGAAEGSQIRAHITELSSAESMLVVRDALLNAHERGVKIKMVNNGDAQQHDALAEALGDDYVHCGTPEVDNTACLSNAAEGTHHMKNWYFSDTKVNDRDYKNMVLISSYNITVTQSENFNDMLVVSGDKALYDAHVKVFDEDYLPQRKTDDRYSQPGGKIAVDSAPGFTAEFSPQKTGDMVADAYKKAEYEDGCELRLANLSLDRDPVVEQILRIKKDGCAVRIVNATALEEPLQKTFDDAGIKYRQVPIHNKMGVFKGKYNGKSDAVQMWTGSQNLSTEPLRYRDDVFVGFNDPDMFDRYGDHFETIWDAASEY